MAARSRRKPKLGTPSPLENLPDDVASGGGGGSAGGGGGGGGGEGSGGDGHVEDRKETLAQQIKLLKKNKSMVEYFLFVLALNANPSRFFPFPETYRTVKIEDRGCFTPYSKDEYKKMSADLKILYDHRDNEEVRNKYKPLLDYILNWGGTMYYMGPMHCESITEYAFEYNEVDERIYNIIKPKRWYLYHGTHLSNWHSILRNGLINASNTSLMTNGAALGAGIYSTTSLATATAYGQYVGLFELIEDIKKYDKLGGIYVINDKPSVKIRYLFDCSRIAGGGRVDDGAVGGKILEKLSREKEKDISSTAELRKIFAIRNEKDMKACSIKLIEDCYTYGMISEDGWAWVILIDGYPVRAPICRRFPGKNRMETIEALLAFGELDVDDKMKYFIKLDTEQRIIAEWSAMKKLRPEMLNAEV